MKEKAKAVSTYILINIILILIFVLVAGLGYMYWKMYGTSETIVAGKNTETTNIAKENAEKVEGSKNIEAITPSITDNATNETTVANKQIKYYYNQLDNNSKKIYDSIERNIENLKTGKYTINLPSDLSSLIADGNDFSALNKCFQSAWDAIIMDRVELFYIDISKVELNIKTVTSENSTKYYLTIGAKENSNYSEDGFENEEDVKDASTKLNNIRNGIIAQLTGDTYNKILQVHDCIVDNIEYGTEISGHNSYNIYGALVNKSAVCEGYAESFKYIMDALNIPCILVVGEATNSNGTTESHEWNYVQIDGKWYAVDTTWDDPILVNGYLTNNIKYKYFLVGSNVIDTNHFPNGKVSQNGISFTYPALEKEKYTNGN